MYSADRALVLGPGGPVGTAWMTGLACGLGRNGVHLGEADLTVGTSAGAIVAALVATGQDLDRLVTPTRPVAPRPEADAERMGQVFAVLGDNSLELGEARRRVGRIALDHVVPEAEAALLAGRGALIGTDRWPDRRLLITAVDAVSGEPVVWDRASGVPFVHAVAASSAFPGAEPPVAIQGRRYMDGALRAGTNADLAAGARTLVVIEPMSRLREPMEQESAVHGAHTVVTISPDPASLDAFGPDLADRAAWEPSYRAGLRQAGDIAGRIRSVWTA